VFVDGWLLRRLEEEERKKEGARIEEALSRTWRTGKKFRRGHIRLGKSKVSLGNERVNFCYYS
jgi:hypothetical protein